MNITLNGQEFEAVWITPSGAQDKEIPPKGLIFVGNSWYGLFSYAEFETLTTIMFEDKKYAVEISTEGTPTVGGSWYIFWNDSWWKLTQI